MCSSDEDIELGDGGVEQWISDYDIPELDITAYFAAEVARGLDHHHRMDHAHTHGHSHAHTHGHSHAHDGHHHHTASPSSSYQRSHGLETPTPSPHSPHSPHSPIYDLGGDSSAAHSGVETPVPLEERPDRSTPNCSNQLSDFYGKCELAFATHKDMLEGIRHLRRFPWVLKVYYQEAALHHTGSQGRVAPIETLGTHRESLDDWVYWEEHGGWQPGDDHDGEPESVHPLTLVDEIFRVLVVFHRSYKKESTTVSDEKEGVSTTRPVSSVGPRRLLASVRGEAGGVQCWLYIRTPRSVLAERQSHDKLRLLFRKLVFSAVLTLPLMLLVLLVPHATSDGGVWHHKWVNGFTLSALLQFLCATPIQFWIGGSFYHGAYHALSHRRANVDVLVVCSTTLAYVYSCVITMASIFDKGASGDDHHATYDPDHLLFIECGILITIIYLGKVMEHVSKGQTTAALRSLPSLQPSHALVRMDLGNGGNGDTDRGAQFLRVPLCLVQVHDVMLVPAESRIPADAVVVSGESHIDQALLTGETKPVLKKPGSVLVGGSYNMHARLLASVTHVGPRSFVGQLCSMVTRLTKRKAPIERFAERISNYFVPFVVLSSVSVFVLWYSLLVSGTVSVNDTHDTSRHNFVFALETAIAVLVIACPCALGLATPTAVMVGTSVGIKHGVLFKSSAVMEKLAGVDRFVFDKTGTLTQGSFNVCHVYDKEDMLDRKDSRHDRPSVTLESWSSGTSTTTTAPNSSSSSTSTPTHHSHTSTSFWNAVSGYSVSDHRIIAVLLGLLEEGVPHPCASSVLRWVNQLLGKTPLQLRTQSQSTQSQSEGAGRGGARGGTVEITSLFALHEWAKQFAGRESDSQDGTDDRDRHGVGVFLQHRTLVRGKGVTAMFAGGQLVLGRWRFVHELMRGEGSSTIDECPPAPVPNLGGFTQMYLSYRGKLLACVSLTDSPKPCAAGVVANLQETGVCYMCTGDARSAALKVAQDVGIDKDRVYAECLPAEKAAIVSNLRQLPKHDPQSDGLARPGTRRVRRVRGQKYAKVDGTDEEDAADRLTGHAAVSDADFHSDTNAGGSLVCMVGDGVNDSLALSAADVGMAMGGGGNELASESADVVLTNGDVRSVYTAVHLARTVLRRISWNYVWALGYNVVAMPLAAGLCYVIFGAPMPPALAAAFEAMSTLMVVASSLWLKTYSPPHPVGDWAETGRGGGGGGMEGGSRSTDSDSPGADTFVHQPLPGTPEGPLVASASWGDAKLTINH